MSFVHLHCRTHYTFLDGAMSPTELVKAVKAHGQSAVAMTDSANLCGMYEFYNACRNNEIKAIYGAELWIGSVPEKERSAPVQLGLFGAPKEEEEPESAQPDFRIVLLIENENGYRNLCTILSTAHLQRYYAPLVTLEQLTSNVEGLICICPWRYGPDEPTIQSLKSIFQENIALEIVRDGSNRSEVATARRRELGSTVGIDVVPTNECLHRDEEGIALLATMRTIATNYGMLDKEAPTFLDTDQLYVKSSEEMAELFTSEEIEATRRIADRCNFTPSLGNVFLPNSTPPEGTDPWKWLLETFPPPRAFDGYSRERPEETLEWDITDAYFAWFCRTGLAIRFDNEPHALQWGTREEYETQMEMEISVIRKMKFPAYHLIVTEFINWAKDNGVPVGPGRGSAAGAIVCWAMRITDVNPLQFGLMFERYLNPERVSMPDIDVDFAQDGRERVIDHVREKYGNDCVCQILTIGTMKAKGALKDCARAIGLGFKTSDRWSKEIPDELGIKLKDGIQSSGYLTRMFAMDPQFRHAAKLALEIEGRPRQTGIHAAGVIITSEPISNLIPCHAYKDKESDTWKPTTGMEMVASEQLGLVKFDFLGLKTLDIIELALDSIQAREGRRPNPIQPNFDDEAVFELLQKGDSLGLFQVESHGMQGLLVSMVPDHMDDIVAISALYRPGPLQSGLVASYVEVKHGRKDPDYPHPLLVDTLKATNGVFVYQEQVMAAARVLAGFSLGEADLLRRAMGKKKQSEMDKQRSKFVEGCRKVNGIDEEDSTRIFNLIDKFAGYGFNKCLAGSTRVLRAGANKDCEPEITIAELYEAQQSRTPWGKKIRAGKLNIAQMHPDGRVRMARMKRIHYSGKKEAFLIRTASGNSICPTAEHRLMTNAGYLHVSDMAPGTILISMGDDKRKMAGPSRHALGKTYSDTHPGRKGAPKGEDNPGWIDGRKILFEEAKADVAERANGACEACGTTFPNPKVHDLEFAHMRSLDECNGDYAEYHSDLNIKHLCNSCHKKLDYEKGERKKRWTKGRPTFEDKIVSIEPIGVIDAYDIEMAGPHHNFIANNIVSHNSHSASYGIITYETAWLKAHYRADLMAAAMTLEASDREKLVAYVVDCSKADVRVLLPHINRSKKEFSVEADPIEKTRLHVRYGLGAIKGVGEAALSEILRQRTNEGPYRSIQDLIQRAAPNKTVLKALVCSGALDELIESRFETWWDISKSKDVEDDNGTIDMFQGAVDEPTSLLEAEENEKKLLKKPEPWNLDEQLDMEREALGCWISGHPLDRFSDIEKRISTQHTADVPNLHRNHSCVLVGVITQIDKRKDRRGNDLTFFTISDRRGMLELMIPQPIFQRVKADASRGVCVMVRGVKDKDGQEGRVQVQSVETLAQKRQRFTDLLYLELTPRDLQDTTLQRVKNLLEEMRVKKSESALHPRIKIAVRLESGEMLIAEMPHKPHFEARQSSFDQFERLLGRVNALRTPG